MSDFKAKMHQIRYRLGLRPRSHWGSLQRSPDSLAGFKGPLRGREGKGKDGEREGDGKGPEDEGREGREREWRREGKGKMGGTGQGIGWGRERRKGREREKRGYSPKL